MTVGSLGTVSALLTSETQGLPAAETVPLVYGLPSRRSISAAGKPSISKTFLRPDCPRATRTAERGMPNRSAMRSMQA